MDKKKKSLNVNPELDNDIQTLNEVKRDLNHISSDITTLSIRKNIILDSRKDIENQNFDADISQLKMIYQQASSLIPNLQRTFEDLVSYHNKMLANKVKFITEELPELDKKIGNSQKELNALKEKEIDLSSKITRSDTFEDLENIIRDLNDLHQRKGSYESIINQITEVEDDLRETNQELKGIDEGLFSENFKKRIDAQLSKFNKIFAETSDSLYGEKYAIKCDVITKKGKNIYKFSPIDTNFSSGKKQGEISCFDIAYTKFADEENGVKAYEVLDTFPGKSLEYKEYEPLFDCAKEICEKQHKKGYYVTCDTYVTMTDGTGIVHIAPAFGEDDSRIGRNYELPFVQFVDGQGNLTKETPYAGVFVKKADPMVLTDLDKEGKLFDAPKFEHDYPHCWRCDTPLIYYARESWFIKMTAVKDDLIRNNNTINWIPESIGKGRFGDWLENVQDWGISRNRYWGTPLNIWQCECGHMHSIGSRQELFEMSGDERAKTVELHRPYIDEITLKCPECGGEMHRVPEVIDCWFDSGAMPFAQHHYPFENKELFEQQFPANFISEAVDQTRGWFYSLLAESTLLFNKAPYKNVIVLGHVQDENGQKMSKSKGNAVDPFDALNKYGADAIRWYFYINSAPWLPNRFHGKAVVEGQRKFMSTLWNTYAFFVLYANIDA